MTREESFRAILTLIGLLNKAVKQPESKIKSNTFYNIKQHTILYIAQEAAKGTLQARVNCVGLEKQIRPEGQDDNILAKITIEIDGHAFNFHQMVGSSTNQMQKELREVLGITSLEDVIPFVPEPAQAHINDDIALAYWAELYNELIKLKWCIYDNLHPLTWGNIMKKKYEGLNLCASHPKLPYGRWKASYLTPVSDGRISRKWHGNFQDIKAGLRKKMMDPLAPPLKLGIQPGLIPANVKRMISAALDGKHWVA